MKTQPMYPYTYPGLARIYDGMETEYLKELLTWKLAEYAKERSYFGTAHQRHHHQIAGNVELLQREILTITQIINGRMS